MDLIIIFESYQYPFIASLKNVTIIEHLSKVIAKWKGLVSNYIFLELVELKIGIALENRCDYYLRSKSRYLG